MTEGTGFLELKQCIECGKAITVLYPHLWRFKRKNRYLCSWSCLRKYDRKEAEEMERLKKDGTPAKKPGRKPGTKPEKAPEVELVYDESIEEEYRREQAQKEANEKAREEAEKAAAVSTQPETDERDQWNTVAVRNKKMGTFYFDERFRTIDWRHPYGEEISLPPEDWKWLGDHIGMIMKALGVDV